MKIFTQHLKFEWDQENGNKNFLKHRVTDKECEESFFDPRKKILKDTIHSGKEKRYLLIGETKFKRLLFLVFTIREDKIRIISARDLGKKERKLYEK